MAVPANSHGTCENSFTSSRSCLVCSDKHTKKQTKNESVQILLKQEDSYSKNIELQVWFDPGAQIMPRSSVFLSISSILKEVFPSWGSDRCQEDQAPIRSPTSEENKCLLPHNRTLPINPANIQELTLIGPAWVMVGGPEPITKARGSASLIGPSWVSLLGFPKKGH